MIKYAVVEHYPDGNSSTIKLCNTEDDAHKYIVVNHYHNCTIEQVYIIKTL